MIISSSFVYANPQLDGRTVVKEQHTDDQGNDYYVDYVAEVGTDLDAHLAASAEALNGSFSQ